MSSRICVKNIPKYVKEDKLREYFSQKGEVTDAKIMRTSDGKSRQFGFIGFRTEKEAEDAMKFFNKSYLDTCRIICEAAYKVGDPNIPRPWSKHTLKKSNKLDRNHESNTSVDASNSISTQKGEAYVTKKSPKEKTETEPKLQEFLQVMQPRVKSKLWANDTVDLSSTGGDMETNGKKTDTKKHKNKSTKMNGGVAEEIPDGVGSDDVNGTEKYSLQDSMVDDISDKDYLNSRINKNWSDTESDDDDSKHRDKHDNGTVGEAQRKPTGGQQDENKESSEGVIDENHDSEKALPKLQDDSEQVLDNGRLFVRNLPFDTNEDELLELFSKYGDVSHVHLVIDKDTKRSKGFGYVLYALPESAHRAATELDNSTFQGRLLHVFPAKPQNLTREKRVPATGQSFKEQRQERKRVAEVGGDTKSWNSLFMRPDTVVENIARKYGVSKSDLLDREADDLAVRIALGETHVIAETKKALSNAGVNVVALEEFASKKKEHHGRSNHVILVKNLPFSSSEGDLVRMFEKFGSLDKIIFPPTKTMALVVFLESAEARAAFRGLAYKCYKDSPLYLEWAPGNILSPSTELVTDKPNIVGEKELNRALLEQTVEGEVELDPDRVESRSIFVKNLNFKTSDEALKKHFDDIMKKGKIVSVKIKKHLKNGKNLSMGYGFIEFDSSEIAAEACKDLQGTVLDGHALILQLCNARKDSLPAKNLGKDSSSTKLIVRNVAFEATEKDLRQLFSPFGQIKSIRLPMKMGGHRGFAFVEYITKQEAQNAMQAMSNTHFYGRHLVLERAKEGESLEELRARTAERFSEGAGAPQKLSKKRKLVAVADEGGVKFESVMD